jgi:carboxyl-terminal processing protease
VQQPFALGDGSMIRLTVARYYTPTGRLIQKSYEEGFDAYRMDLIDRYNQGELTSADSIAFPDSLKYETLQMKRTVYGGGGIMPDYFVPVDTSAFSEYYRQLINKGIFNRFVLQYVDGNREKLYAAHPDFDHYAGKFETEKEHLDALIAFAEEEGLAFDQEDWDVSSGQISMLMKAYIARDLWERGSFFEIYNQHNPMFRKAIEVLEEPGLLSEKLAQNRR